MNCPVISRSNRTPGKHSFIAAWGTCAVATLIFIMASCHDTKTSGVTIYPSDLASDNTKGPVTEITTVAYLLDSTGKRGDISEKYIVKYDSAGFITTVTTTNGKDSLKSTATFAHSAAGLLTSQLSTDGNNKKTYSLVIEYDSTGKPTIAKTYDSTGKMDAYYTDLGLSKYGKYTSGKEYHLDSTLKLSWENNYDSTHYIGGSGKDSTGKVTYSSTIKLDNLGNPEKMEETAVTKDSATKQDVTKKTTTTYTYGGTDSHGNWTEQTEHLTSDDKTKVPHLYKRVMTYKQ
ncbi:MAG: hypothetical protein ABI472_06535 [Ginsengibacter sp.]